MAGKINLEDANGYKVGLTVTDGVADRVIDVETALANRYTKAEVDAENDAVRTEIVAGDELNSKLAIPFNGVVGGLKDNIFKTDENFTYKTAIDGEHFKVNDKVVGVLGDEEVVNGDFSLDDSNWEVFNATKTYYLGSVIISDAQDTGSYSSIGQTISSLQQGKSYQLTINTKLDSTNWNVLIKDNSSHPGGDVVEGGITSDGLKTFTFIASTRNYLAIGVEGTGTLSIDNISVREIKTIELGTTNDRTDFAGVGDNSFVPHVEVLDQATYGLTVQDDIKVGDYVVLDKEELVDNGTFDSEVGWTLLGHTISGGTLNSVSQNTSTKQDIGAIDGVKYAITYTLSGTLTNFVAGIGSNYGSIKTEIGTYTDVVVANGDLLFRLSNSSVGDFTVDNVSVQLAEDTYRATQDVPALTELTNTTYFETRDYISNQVLSVLADDGIIHSEVLINDIAEGTPPVEYLTNNGWSYLGDGLFSKDGVIGTSLGMWQTLNKGAFNPFFNKYGVRNFHKKDTNTGSWNIYGASIDNITMCFIDGGTLATGEIGYRAVSGYIDSSEGSGHPDSKFYDIIYPDQWIDLKTSAEYDIETVDSRANKLVNGSLEGVSGEVGMVQVTQTTTGLVDTLEVDTKLKYQVGMVLQIWDGTGPYRRTITAVNGTTVTMNETIDKTAVPFLIGGGKVPVLSSGTSLSIDIIGQPW